MKRRSGDVLTFPWKRFLARHHGQLPAVFRNVLDRPLAAPSEVFEAMTSLLATEGSSKLLRIAGGSGGRLESRRALHPRSDDRSVARYIERLSRRVSDAGIVVNELQAGSGTMWARTAPFLHQLYEHVGFPTGGALLDLFAGTYRRSFLGVHKDEQDVFTFVLSGRKRFLVWPFDSLARRFAVDESKRFAPHSLVGANADALRNEALVLEAGPRDVIYWPAEWWHTAESDGSPVITLALGIFRRQAPLALFSRTLDELRRARPGQAAYQTSDTLPYETSAEARARSVALRRDAWKALLQSPELERQEAIVHEAWLSAMGFARTPPRRTDFSVRRTDRVQVAFRGGMRFFERDDELLLCAGGHSLALPRHSRILALLELLQSGRPHPVDALVRRFERGARRGERQLSNDLIMYLLNWLGGSHVLARVPRSDSRSSNVETPGK